MISNDDTFLSNVGAHFSVDQNRSNRRSVSSQLSRAKTATHSVCVDNPSSTLNNWCSASSGQRTISDMKANIIINKAILSWCRNTSLTWTWAVPECFCLLISLWNQVIVEWWHPNRCAMTLLEMLI